MITLYLPSWERGKTNGFAVVKSSYIDRIHTCSGFDLIGHCVLGMTYVACSLVVYGWMLIAPTVQCRFCTPSDDHCKRICGTILDDDRPITPRMLCSGFAWSLANAALFSHEGGGVTVAVQKQRQTRIVILHGTALKFTHPSAILCTVLHTFREYVCLGRMSQRDGLRPIGDADGLNAAAFSGSDAEDSFTGLAASSSSMWDLDGDRQEELGKLSALGVEKEVHCG